MTANTNRGHVRSACCTGFPWTWPVTAFAIAAIVIAFRRSASNERVAHAVALGVARRHRESAASQPSASESSPK